jgi:hypothetical protein
MTTLSEQVRVAINRDKHFTHQQKRTQRQVAGLQNNAIEATSAFTSESLKGTANHLISGNAVWDTGLTFNVSQCVYVIQGDTYNSLPNTVTLADADATNPRIDVIAIGPSGVPVVVSGTAGATPVKPEVAADQVEITFATVAALATTPTGVSDTTIYDEDDDWTSAVGGSGSVDAAATLGPNSGTKHIQFGTTAVGTATGDYCTLTTGTAIPVSSIETLKFYIDNLRAAATGKKQNRTYLRLAWYNGTTRVSDWVNLTDGQFGYQQSQAGYQLIGIPMSAFNPNGTAVTVLRLEAVGTNTFHVDDIDYQEGVTSPTVANYAYTDQTNVFTKAQASRIKAQTDGATITIDLSTANVFSVVLDGNRTIDFTNATPGQHFTFFVIQDATTGSRTLTWDAANKWAGGTAPTLSTAVNAVDVLTFAVDASGNIHGSLGIADSK